jgi:sec-independent protein translocase protein TatB
MFDIGAGELLVIGVVALVAIGPKELPGVLRTVGQAVGKMRRMAGEFQDQFREAMREAELEEARKSVSDIGQSVASSFDPATITTPPPTLEPPALSTPVDPATVSATAPEPMPDIVVPLPEPVPNESLMADIAASAPVADSAAAPAAPEPVEAAAEKPKKPRAPRKKAVAADETPSNEGDA